MDVLPVVNELIVLRDSADRDYQSRVEDLGPAAMTVAQPLDLPVDHTLGPGSDLLALWNCPRGIAVLPLRITDAYAEHGLRLWTAAMTGPGWVEQRRRFVRIPASGPVRLHSLVAGPAPEPVPAKLVEISEGALRCTIRDDALAQLGDPGPVLAVFRYGDTEFSISSHINVRRAEAHRDDPIQVVIEFDEPVRDADALRKLIFTQQQRTFRPR